MQVVIDIPEEQYEYLSKIANAGEEPLGYFERVILRGTPLPKGHGRLKDVDWIDNNCEYHYSEKAGCWCYSGEDVMKAPTIIEADKGEGEEKDDTL